MELEESKPQSPKGMQARSLRTTFTDMTIEHSTENLKVFCVSSKEFHHFKGNSRYESMDDPPFENIEGTMIPSVQKFLVSLASDENEKVLDKLIARWNILRPKVQMWVGIKDADIQLPIDKTKELEKALEDHLQTFKKSCDKTMTDFLKGVRKSLAQIPQNLVADVKDWKFKTIHSAEFGQKDIGVQTIRATVNRDGYFNRKGKNDINLNGGFVALYIQPIARLWQETFGKMMLDHYIKFEVNTIKHMRT